MTQTGKRFLLFIFAISYLAVHAQSAFVQTKNHQFVLNGQPYYYVGANYWYGGLLSLQPDSSKGIERLRQELDFLQSKGVQNLRVLGGTEGAGTIQGVQRVQPPYQTAKGVFDDSKLYGLDVLLSEMGKRNMKAVIYVSNNWEWSGGFLQYLNWNGKLPDALLQKKLSWDSLRNVVSTFYSCADCVKDYLKQVQKLVERTNTVTGKKYKDDAAIMSWELANEPRPMRIGASEAYLKWIDQAASFLHSKDKNHLVTTGSEGRMGTENTTIFQASHAFKNVDYLTIHIWPKNWGWFKPETMQADLPTVITQTNAYIREHDSVANVLNKPLVIEEFGLPRDGHSYSLSAATGLRDEYYKDVFSFWQQSKQQGGAIGGINFWAFGGTARPIASQTFWKQGDNYLGDPPMEEQGLNTVFDSDNSTWQVITTAAQYTDAPTGDDLPADKAATKETVALYRNLKRLADSGKTIFGHQDDLAYGVGWKYERGRSDIKEVTGDYPALYGWELGNLEYDSAHNLDSVPFDKMKGFIKDAYNRGGAITIGWHMDNPVNGESAWDTTHGGVTAILPGGAKHELYKTWLNKFAVFMNDLKGKNGEAIPILFRPFHELTGNWFWWCRNGCTPDEYKALWRFTAAYLQNEKGLHNLLYVYNTAGDFSNSEQFLQRYPGDNVVDVVSFDSYQGGDAAKDSSFTQNVSQRLGIINSVARQHDKIPALAEAGYEAIPYAQWWTRRLLPALSGQPVSYVLIWRNHGRQPNGHMHYYAPYKGHASAPDFQNFYKADNILFEKKLAKEKVYQ